MAPGDGSLRIPTLTELMRRAYAKVGAEPLRDGEFQLECVSCLQVWPVERLRQVAGPMKRTYYCRTDGAALASVQWTERAGAAFAILPAAKAHLSRDDD